MDVVVLVLCFVKVKKRGVCCNSTAVNKTRIGLLGSDRIGSDSGSDRIGLRIGLVSSLLEQKNYFDKNCFNNDTGGSE